MNERKNQKNIKTECRTNADFNKCRTNVDFNKCRTNVDLNDVALMSTLTSFEQTSRLH
jgi:hypothetical protein